MLLTEDTLLIYDNFSAKFIRIGNEIYITDPDDLTTLHIKLAEKEKILDKITELKSQRINDLDGGEIFIKGRIIKIGGASSSLYLPQTPKARQQTIDRLKHRFPNYHTTQL